MIRDGILVAGVMDADEFGDYLELRDPKVRQTIQKSHREFLAGKTRPAEKLLAELQADEAPKLTRPPKK